MKFNKNNYIFILLFFIIVIILLLLIYKNSIENFTNSNIVKNNNIHNITLDPNDNLYNKYFGSFIKSSSNKNINNGFNLFKIDDTFASNKWIKVNDFNDSLFIQNNIIIYDITYDKNKKMMCIGLFYDKDNNPIYNIYRKNDINLNSEWELLAYDSKIKSLCYDIKTEKLLGISSYNGQIYQQNDWNYFGNTTPMVTTVKKESSSLNQSDKNTSNTLVPKISYNESTNLEDESDSEYLDDDESEDNIDMFQDYSSNKLSNNDIEDNKIEGWTGPINHDKPMKKIMYSSDEIMIGIGLFDNFIYKKEGNNWKTSYWDTKQINKTRVYDLIYDSTGCFIATSSNGILIQNQVGFMMPFINYLNYNRHNKKNLLLKPQILKYKLGYNILNDDNLKIENHPNVDINLFKYLQKIYEIKKLSLDLCSSRKYIRNKDKQNDNNSLNYKYREIDDLYEKIEEINESLTE